MNVIGIVDASVRLCRVEDRHGRRGLMVRIGTPCARLEPTGRHRYTCPYCGRYIKARGQRCRDCLGDALGGRAQYQWAKDELAARSTATTTRKALRQGEALAFAIERELIETMVMV